MANDFFSFVWDAITGEAERRMRRSEERRIRAKEDLMSRLELDADGLITIDSRSPSRVAALLFLFFAGALFYAGIDIAGQRFLFIIMGGLMVGAAYAAATQGSRAAVELDARLLHVWKSRHAALTGALQAEQHTSESLDNYSVELRFERRDQEHITCRVKLGNYTLSVSRDPEVARVEAIAWAEFLGLPRRVQQGFPV